MPSRKPRPLDGSTGKTSWLKTFWPARYQTMQAPDGPTLSIETAHPSFRRPAVGCRGPRASRAGSFVSLACTSVDSGPLVWSTRTGRRCAIAQAPDNAYSHDLDLGDLISRRAALPPPLHGGSRTRTRPWYGLWWDIRRDGSTHGSNRCLTRDRRTSAG